ncbi:MAG: hypothetical protein V7746_06920 [Halioglobus sp.]
MKRTHNAIEPSSVSEIAIVDTFTKLIFGEEAHYSELELDIIHALRQVDHNMALDEHREMGRYLRAMGVREMIGLVTEVRIGMAEESPQVISGTSADSSFIRKSQ